MGWKSTMRAIRAFLPKALARKSGNDLWLDYDRVSDDEARKIKAQTGLDVAGYTHSLDESAARHMLKEHGDPGRQAALGQLPLTEDDLTRLPGIVHNFDSVSRGNKLRGLDTVIFSKIFPDGTHYFVEEVRTGRRKLAAKTMWKERAAAPRAAPEGGVAHTSETFRSRAEPGHEPSSETTISPPGGPVKKDEPPLAPRIPDPDNTGRWAREGVSDILNRNNRERAQAWFAPKLDAARLKLQDRFLMLKRHQEAVAARSGPIPEHADAYLAQTLYHGKAEARLTGLKNTHLDPLIQAIHEAGASIEQIDEFLYALHAEERNRLMESRNPRFDPNSDEYGRVPGSGMTADEAAAILAEAKRLGLTDKLMAIANQIQALNNATLEGRIADGLMTRDRPTAGGRCGSSTCRCGAPRARKPNPIGVDKRPATICPIANAAYIWRRDKPAW